MSKLKDALSKHTRTWINWPPGPPDINPWNYCGANAGQGLSKQPTQEIRSNI